MSDLATFLAGAVAMGFSIAGLCFLRFWASSRESLFLIFAIAFWLFAANQALVGLHVGSSETTFALYSLRLAGFLLIALAVALKNRKARS